LPKGTNFFELSEAEAQGLIEKKLANPATESVTVAKKKTAPRRK
jgi:hypothetical protein